MTNYKQGDIVVTDFPYSDANNVKRRPALIISKPFKISSGFSLFWLLMITTTELKGYEGDIDIDNLKKSGLPHPSIVRSSKVANVQDSLIRKKIGTLDTKTRRKVREFLLSNIKL